MGLCSLEWLKGLEARGTSTEGGGSPPPLSCLSISMLPLHFSLTVCHAGERVPTKLGHKLPQAQRGGKDKQPMQSYFKKVQFLAIPILTASALGFALAAQHQHAEPSPAPCSEESIVAQLEAEAQQSTSKIWGLEQKEPTK